MYYSLHLVHQRLRGAVKAIYSAIRVRGLSELASKLVCAHAEAKGLQCLNHANDEFDDNRTFRTIYVYKNTHNCMKSTSDMLYRSVLHSLGSRSQIFHCLATSALLMEADTQ